MTKPNLYRVDVPGPNVYLASITSPLLPEGCTAFHVAADFTGGALRKVQRLVADQFGFRPTRLNSLIQLKRFRLGDYLDNPQGLLSAWETAYLLNESDMLNALAARPKVVADLLRLSQPSHDDVWQRLSAAMQEGAHG